MRSPKQVELPLWTAQFVTVVPQLILCALAVGILCGREVSPYLFLGMAALCVQITGWVLRVPSKLLETTQGLLQRLTGKSPEE